MEKVYTVFDKVAGKSLATFMAPNDGLAIRENVPSLSRVIPLGDAELRCIADIDTDKSVLIPYSEYSIVEWDSYKFPENPIAPLNKDSKVKMPAKEM